jgi:hypothetical protein
MIFFSVGLPGSATLWFDAVLHRLAEKLLGPVVMGPVNSVDDLASVLIGTGASHLVACVRQPDARLRQIQAASHARILLVQSDPLEAVANLVITEGQTPVAAAKRVANACASQLRYADDPTTCVLSTLAADFDRSTACLTIAAHFGLALDQQQISEAIETIGVGPTGMDPAAVQAWWAGLSPSTQQLIDGVLAGYAEYARHGHLGKFSWGPAFFFLGDDHASTISGSIDITGRSRCLIFGPYFVVPPGSWTAHIRLGCSREALGMAFFIEIVTGKQLASSLVRVTADGIFKVSLEFVMEDLDNDPLQIRVYNHRAAFDGRLALLSVDIVPQVLIEPLGAEKRAELDLLLT